MTREEARRRMRKYCSYRDRCHSEVRTKLLSLKVYGQKLEELMTELIEDGYLNEERFSQNFARGKFRMKGWGKNKIKQELKRRGINEYCIKKAIQEIEKENNYADMLKKQIIKYTNARTNKYPNHELRRRVYTHCIRKGYEPELVSSCINQIFSISKHKNTHK